MGSKTKIEWTDATWNPFMGCSRVSEGCRHCYAERIAGRFVSARPNGSAVYDGLTQIVNGHPVWSGVVKQASLEKRTAPLRWRKPRRVFVDSTSDLFHENAPDEWIDQAFAVMALCPQHTFQILTKRPERMLDYLSDPLIYIRIHRQACQIPCPSDVPQFVAVPPLPNVWLGVSVEHQAAADERIPLLLRTPAAVRFISAEPLLGRVDLHLPDQEAYPLKMRPVAIQRIHWVICGGESGPGARPMHPDWARSLRDQCRAANVPFFFKQWGEWLPEGIEVGWKDVGRPPRNAEHLWIAEDGTQHTGLIGSNDVRTWRVGKKAAGALLDGREWRQFPEVR
jgi:protein gp37